METRQRLNLAERAPIKEPLVRLLFDSGAFGAWKRGETLNLDEYIRYVKACAGSLFAYVNLDVIPGSYGMARALTHAEVERSAWHSYENLHKMKAEGLSPIPVFHQGESFSWLEKLLIDGEPYIGISPMLSNSKTSHIIKWMDRCFTMITDNDGHPYVKTHGFGVTDQVLLQRYPWYTVDSTSWTMGPAYGMIPVPSFVGGKWDYYKHFRRIVMTGQLQMAGTQRYQFEHLGPYSQDIVRKFLLECGLEPGDVRNSELMRRRVWLKYYDEMLKNTLCERFQHRRQSLSINLPRKLKPQGPWHVMIMFATLIKHSRQATLLTETGTNTRLVSYYDCRDIDPSVITQYVTAGIRPGYKPVLWPKPNWNNEHYKSFRRMSALNHLRALNASPRLSEEAGDTEPSVI